MLLVVLTKFHREIEVKTLSYYVSNFTLAFFSYLINVCVQHLVSVSNGTDYSERFLSTCVILFRFNSFAKFVVLNITDE